MAAAIESASFVWRGLLDFLVRLFGFFFAAIGSSSWLRFGGPGSAPCKLDIKK